MKKLYPLILLLLLPSSFLAAEDLSSLLNDDSLRPGLCVVVGCDSAQSLIGAQQDGKFLVQGVCADQSVADAIHAELAGQGLTDQVSVAMRDGTQLPYVDNLVNVLVLQDRGDLGHEEIMRVVAPFGVVLFKKGGQWERIEKAYPEAMSDWPMYSHDPKRTNVIADEIVDVPSGLQWVSGSAIEEYMTNQVITSNGRIFYSRSRHMKNKAFVGTRGLLVARDAFNGLLLWEKELDAGHPWLRSCMAVHGGRLYTSGDEGMAALDVKTGEVLQTYKGVNSKEVTYYDGKLVVGKGQGVVDAISGAILWQKRIPTYFTDEAIIDDGRILTTSKTHIICMDLMTGEDLWTIPVDGNARLVSLWEDLFFVKVTKLSKNQFYVFSVIDGSLVWEREGIGFTTIVDGLGWVSRSHPDKPKNNQGWIGLDPRTGEMKQEFDYGDMYVKGPRCYPPRATNNFFMPNYGALSFFDPAANEVRTSFAGRGTCRFGLLPSNGMVYQPVHACTCFPMIRGDVAFTCVELPDLSEAASVSPELVKGAAFARPAGAVNQVHAEDWPTLRNDAGRLGSTVTALGQGMKLKWQTEVGGRLSSPVIAAGRAYVAVPELHQVVSLDAASGEVAWRYTASASVDTPPTIVGNLVLFGSADGWAYCLDSKDGALRWRFRAAPLDRRIVARRQLESLWPVHGNLLVVDGTVFVSAGRQTELSGGIYLYALDAASGAVQWRKVVARSDYQKSRDGWSVDASNNRILTYANGVLELDRSFYDPKTGESVAASDGSHIWGGLIGLHLDNISLDDLPKGEMLKYWTYGNTNRISIIKSFHLRQRNKANLLAVKGEVVFGLLQFNHVIFASPVDAVNVMKKSKEPTPLIWEQTMAEDSVMNSLITAGDFVLVGGYDPSGGKLWIFSAESGETVSELTLPVVPRFDGLAVADGALFITANSGSVVCFSGE